MNFRTSRLLVGIGTLSCTFATAAAPVQHACESWHPRLGQAPDDFKFALDLVANRCSGEPCTITDKELTWSIQGGRYTVTINRLTNEGQMIREGELLALLKNCRPA